MECRPRYLTQGQEHCTSGLQSKLEDNEASHNLSATLSRTAAGTSTAMLARAHALRQPCAKHAQPLNLRQVLPVSCQAETWPAVQQYRAAALLVTPAPSARRSAEPSRPTAHALLPLLARHSTAAPPHPGTHSLRCLASFSSSLSSVGARAETGRRCLACSTTKSSSSSSSSPASTSGSKWSLRAPACRQHWSSLADGAHQRHDEGARCPACVFVTLQDNNCRVSRVRLLQTQLPPWAPSGGSGALLRAASKNLDF